MKQILITGQVQLADGKPTTVTQTKHGVSPVAHVSFKSPLSSANGRFTNSSKGKENAGLYSKPLLDDAKHSDNEGDWPPFLLHP